MSVFAGLGNGFGRFLIVVSWGTFGIFYFYVGHVAGGVDVLEVIQQIIQQHLLAVIPVILVLIANFGRLSWKDR